jgi:hypothetical protein
MQTLPYHGLYNEWGQFNLQMSWDWDHLLARSFAAAAICDSLPACVVGESSGWRQLRRSLFAVDPCLSAVGADSP